MMKLIVFDVGNAACSIISSPNNIGMMIDWGSSNEKDNPVDLYKKYKTWLGIQPFMRNGTQYELGLLHITHPDDDHVKNIQRIEKDMKPCLLHKRECEEFLDSDTINQEYRDIEKKYRNYNSTELDWRFDKNETFSISMDDIKANKELSEKQRNNSSIIRFIQYSGIKVLYCGDMEKPGWEWLVNHNKQFVQTVSEGIDILIAPHHGHKSGFPSALFDVIGNVKCVIHSKGSEGDKEDSDVSTQYSSKAIGVQYTNLTDNSMYKGQVLTTRSNGNIFIKIADGNLTVWADKASSNHTKLS